MPKKETEYVSFTFGGREFEEQIEGSFILDELSVTEIKERLNVLPGRFAYWKRVLVRIELTLEDFEERMTHWQAEKYMEVDSAPETPSKATEAWKKQAVLLNNAEEWKRRSKEIRDLKDAKGSAEAIVKALEMQSNTLRQIARVTEAELYKTLHPQPVRGVGNLAEEV